ncbi:MAB_1171c family putative transporter [Streptomyces sp. NPDC006529]|uniref:MAB_1171c family putative transporter n=1 Tax=Streptomyces sp. NPDC006529 TaxID=3157177 RepID=UPI0033BADE8B
MRSAHYYVPAAVLALVFLVKAPALLRTWHNPMVRGVAGLILLIGSGFFFAAPPTIGYVNRTTGVDNFSGPLVYSILSGCSTLAMVLLTYWRSGFGETVRRQVRGWLWGGALVIVSIAVLFASGDAPSERVRDMDTFYATTPGIREMIVLYLLWHTAIHAALTLMCLKWLGETGGWLRTGLGCLVAGFGLGACFGVAKGVALGARWSGVDLDFLSTELAPPAAGIGSLLCAAGFLLPQGERAAALLGTWRRYRELGPLWRALRAIAPQPDLTLALRRPSLDERLAYRETDVHDQLIALAPACDPVLMTERQDSALRAGMEPEQARCAGAAAMIAEAIAVVAARAQGAEAVDEGERAAGFEAVSLLLAGGGAAIARVARHYGVLSSRRTVTTGPARLAVPARKVAR